MFKAVKTGVQCLSATVECRLLALAGSAQLITRMSAYLSIAVVTLGGGP